jgi:two-component system, cell cycle sensor histidine kinase and response regulator CckA
MGTTFHVFLPALSKSPQLQKTVMAQPQNVPALRLLFMDDDVNIRRLIKEMMDYLGHEAEYARNGEEAVELFRLAKESGTAFNVVIIDLTIKEGMGGDKAIKKLLEIDPEVKAVISSGYVDAPIIKDYQNYGFVDAIVKPYKIEQLKELIDKLNFDT